MALCKNRNVIKGNSLKGNCPSLVVFLAVNFQTFEKNVMLEENRNVKARNVNVLGTLEILDVNSIKYIVDYMEIPWIGHRQNGNLKVRRIFTERVWGLQRPLETF